MPGVRSKKLPWTARLLPPRVKQERITGCHVDYGSAIPVRRMQGVGQHAPKLCPAVSAGKERDCPDVLRRRKGGRRRAPMVLPASSLLAAVLLVVPGTARPRRDSRGPVSARERVRRALGDFQRTMGATGSRDRTTRPWFSHNPFRDVQVPRGPQKMNDRKNCRESGHLPHTTRLFQRGWSPR